MPGNGQPSIQTETEQVVVAARGLGVSDRESDVKLGAGDPVLPLDGDADAFAGVRQVSPPIRSA